MNVIMSPTEHIIYCIPPFSCKHYLHVHKHQHNWARVMWPEQLGLWDSIPFHCHAINTCFITGRSWAQIWVQTSVLLPMLSTVFHSPMMGSNSNHVTIASFHILPNLSYLSCTSADGHNSFRATCCLHLQGRRAMASSTTLVSTKLHGVTSNIP